MKPKAKELELASLKREQIKSQLSRFKIYLGNQSDTNPDLNQIETRLSKIETLIAEFETVQLTIESLDETTAAEVHQNEHEAFENSYYDTITNAKRLLSVREAAEQTSGLLSSHSDHSSHATTQIKLPTINLPSFDGSYTQWLFFRDTFNSIIHENESMSKIQKFHYLRLSLKGAAADVVNSLEIADSTYEQAWNLLLERFENKSLLINNHIKAILHMPSITKESYANLRSIWDNMSNHIRALEVLGQPVKQWDALIIAIITEKLDPNTEREWEEKHGNETPKFETFDTFLKSKCRLLEKPKPNCVKSPSSSSCFN